MQCPSCGKPVAKADRYCAACLAPLPTPEVPAEPPAAGEPPAAAHHAADAGHPPASLPSDPWTAPPAAPPEAGGFAGFWIRLAALLVDSMVVVAGSFVITLVVGLAMGAGAILGASGDPTGPWLVLSLVLSILLFVAQWGYFAVMESSGRQATLGKLALGLAVTDLEGRRIGLGRATGRFLAKILSGIPANLGYVLAAFTARKQALHDFVAGTLVVRRRPASVAAVVLSLAVGFLGATFLTGVVAAIAIPNFMRYQLRAKDTEAAVMLRSLHDAEVAHHAREGSYLELALPQGAVGTEKLPWSEEDVGAAEALGWEARGPTWFAYRVAVGATDEGAQAFATCAESDLDGDGRVAAWVTWQPIELPGGTVAAPEPPCALDPVLARPLELQPDDVPGVPVRVSPPDVF